MTRQKLSFAVLKKLPLVTAEELSALRSITAEIVDAVNALIASGKQSVTEDEITAAIYSGVCPPPDMIVRTGGEKRLSNFLLWQSSYSELFFTDTLWPDFTTEELDGIIAEFSNRKRRYGGV